MSWCCFKSSYVEIGDDDPPSYKKEPITLCESESTNNLIGFFILGMINNFGYVVFLSAAGDLMDPFCLPISTIVLAENIPVILAQGIAPLFIERVPYYLRVLFITITACGSFVVVAFFESVEMKILGIVVASVSSGFGEITWMSYSSFYHKNTVSLYSSGTGAAGVVGSLAYLALHTWIGISPSDTLMMSSPLPLLMGVSYFFILAEGQPIGKSKNKEDNDMRKEIRGYSSDDILLADKSIPKELTVAEKIKMQPGLFKYTLPLFAVYYAEYVINYGITPALTFPNNSTFSGNEYIYYQFVYQTGVLISRSSVNFVPIRRTWILGGLQFTNMVLLLVAAYYQFIPSIYIYFVIILFEGLLGGAVYVNTFFLVSDEVDENIKEFCMSSLSFWYSSGILLSGFTGMWIQPWLTSDKKLCIPGHGPVPAPSPTPTNSTGPISPSIPNPMPGPVLSPTPANITAPLSTNITTPTQKNMSNS